MKRRSESRARKRMDGELEDASARGPNPGCRVAAPIETIDSRLQTECGVEAPRHVATSRAANGSGRAAKLPRRSYCSRIASEATFASGERR